MWRGEGGCGGVWEDVEGCGRMWRGEGGCGGVRGMWRGVGDVEGCGGCGGVWEVVLLYCIAQQHKVPDHDSRCDLTVENT